MVSAPMAIMSGNLPIPPRSKRRGAEGRRSEAIRTPAMRPLNASLVAGLVAATSTKDFSWLLVAAWAGKATPGLTTTIIRSHSSMLLRELLGYISGRQCDGLVIDIPHAADGQHVRAEFGPLAVEEVGYGGVLEFEQSHRCVCSNTTGVVDDGGDLPRGVGLRDFVAGEGTATTAAHDTTLGSQPGQCPPYSRPGNTVLAYERWLTGQRFASAYIALRKRLGQDRIDLQITRDAYTGVCCSRHDDEPPFLG